MHSRVPGYQTYFWGTRVPNLVMLVIPGYRTWLCWSYPGTEPGYVGHTRVPNLVRLVIPGYQTCVCWSYPGTEPGYVGHTRVPNLVMLVIPGYQTWLCWSYPGRYSLLRPDHTPCYSKGTLINRSGPLPFWGQITCN